MKCIGCHHCHPEEHVPMPRLWTTSTRARHYAVAIPVQCTSGGERRETMTGCYDCTFPTLLRDQAVIFILVDLERPAK